MMSRRMRSCSRRAAAVPLVHQGLFPITLALVGGLAACSESSDDPASTSAGGGSGGVENGGSAASDGTTKIGSGIGGSGFNQCGVAAPLPADTGQCTAVSAPTIAEGKVFNF